MKAIITSQRVSANVNDFVHGGGKLINRLVVPLNDNTYMMINFYEGQLYIFRAPDLSQYHYTVVGEVDVPTEIYEAAIAILMDKEALDRKKSAIKEGIQALLSAAE